MTFYKPLIWYLIIGWSENTLCDYLTTKVLDIFVTENTLTSSEQLSICTTGVEMYWEQFYYGGSIDNQPYDLSWAWTAS